jgi:hypothetical protein
MEEQNLVEHETISTSVKIVDVDKGIKPLISWINSFKGIYTLFSCEGYDDTYEIPEAPYVMFISLSVDDLCKFLLHIKSSSFLYEIHVIYLEGLLKYCIRFNSKKDLNYFYEREIF